MAGPAAVVPVLEGSLPLLLDGTPQGSTIRIILPRPGKLSQASLLLRADSDAESPLLPDAAASSVLDGSQALRWANAKWLEERAIVAIKVVATAPGATDGRCGVRVRALSLGNWQPLSPIDSLGLDKPADAPNSDKVSTSLRFPALAANQVLLEMLSENKLDNKLTGVLVPGSVKASAISLTASAQPCHVSISLDAAAPFFSLPGPLPVQSVNVEGLVAVLNRYIEQHPASLRIELNLRALGRGKIRIESFSAQQQPLPEPGQSGTGTGTGTGTGPGTGTGSSARPEQVWLAAVKPAARLSAQLARAHYRIAAGFAALPPGQALSSLGLFMRASTPQVQAQILLYPDQQGQPGNKPLLPPLPLNFSARSDDEPDWVKLSLSKPAALPACPWWLVLEVLAGEALWYLGQAPRPPQALTLMTQTQPETWLPLPAPASNWLQTLINLAPPDKP